MFNAQDRENASQIKVEHSLYYMSWALEGYCEWYFVAAPFKNHFFKARLQLDDAIWQLGYKRVEHAYSSSTRALLSCMTRTACTALQCEINGPGNCLIIVNDIQLAATACQIWWHLLRKLKCKTKIHRMRPLQGSGSRCSLDQLDCI
jgi:hypothetical protein